MLSIKQAVIYVAIATGCVTLSLMKDDIINNCTLFKGLSRNKLDEALKFFCASKQIYKKGDFLNRISEPLDFFALVLSGNIQVCCDDLDGNRIIMASVEPGETFGESLCFLKREAPVYIVAAADSEVLKMNTSNITSDSPSVFSLRFTSMLAERTLSMNNRIQILSKKTIREKILTLLSINSGGKKFSLSLPLSRNDMADYLGSDRSSLSRELSRMKKEGLINYKNNTFEIL